MFYRLAVLLTPLLLSASLCAQAQGFGDRSAQRAFAQDISARHGLDAAQVEAALLQSEHLPKVIDLIRPPADPGVRSWHKYRARFVEPVRIRAGTRFWQEHETTLLRAETEFGVPREIIAAIIGVETIYGRNTGTFRTLDALATLAFDYPPRAELFRKELEALFLLARDQRRPVESYRGSFAGALGLPQFLPSSVRDFAVDFDGDGGIDLSNSPTDAIGSVASFLARHGWQRGGPIVSRARFTDAADPAPLLAAGILPQFDATALAQAGVLGTLTMDEPAALIDLASPGHLTEYWLGYRNFYAITRYNRSSFYAMAVHDLARALYDARPDPTRSAQR